MTAPTGERLVTDYFARLEAAALRLPPDRRADLLEGIAEHVAEARAAGELRDETAVRTLLDRLGEPAEIVAAAGEDDAGSGSTGGGGPPRWAPPGPRLAPSPPGTGLEVAAVVMLSVGSLLPLVGWLVGVALLWSSRRWRVPEKLLGTLVVPGGPGIVLWLGGFLAGTESCTTTVTGTGEGLVLEVPGEPPPAPPPAAEPPAPPPAPPPQPPLQPPLSEPQGVFETTVCESSGGLVPGGDLPGWAVIAVVAIALVAPVVVAVVLLRRARARAAAEAPVMRTAGSSGWTGLEIAAVVVLGLGSFVVPFVGHIVGLVLVWVSPRWTSVEKGLATGLGVLPIALLSAYFGVASVGFGFPGLGLFGAFVLGAVGPLLATVYLAVVLSRRSVG